MTDIRQRIEAANQEVVKRIVSARPYLIDMAPASEVVPGLSGKGLRRVHHSGPPITPQRMCGAQKGSIVCAVLTEGWASTPEEAFRMIDSGEIELGSNHEHQSVGPMAGVVSPSTWVYVVENRTYGNVAFAPEQQGRTTFGAYGPEILAHRRLSRDIVGPTIRQALKHTGPIDLGEIIAQGLFMGDEMHNRVAGGGCLLFRALAPGLLEVGGDAARATMRYLVDETFYFLAVAMAASKATADAAAGVDYSTVVYALSRNGTDFGIRVSGLGKRWFTGPSQKVKGLYMPGYGDADAGLDMGDSAIVEAVGLGGSLMAGAAALLNFVGGTAADALSYLPRARQICAGENPRFTVPIHDFAPAPTGIDIRLVVKTGILPLIDTAIAHKDPGHPILGAGIVYPPLSCFSDALKAFGAQYLPKA